MEQRSSLLREIFILSAYTMIFQQPLAASMLSFGDSGEGVIWLDGNTATYDIEGNQGNFAWRMTGSSTAKNKMHLSESNVLTLYKADGANVGLILDAETGKITLNGSSSGIFFGSNTLPTISAGTGGKAVFNSGLEVSSGALSVTSTTEATSSITGALIVSGGIGASKDSWINGVRVGRGGGNNGDNTTLGNFSLPVNTTGNANTAIGNSALRRNTGGFHNTSIGFSSMEFNVNSNYNTAIGSYALHSNTGNSNTVVGRSALMWKSGGNNDVAIGYHAGEKQADGVSNLTSSANSIYIGANSRGLSNHDFNSIVIGTGAIGRGANTTVIGNEETLNTHLFGAVSASGGAVEGYGAFGVGGASAIGSYNVAFSEASVYGQFSFGASFSSVSATYATALSNSSASGNFSTALSVSNASGYGSTAMSSGSSSGDYSLAAGVGAQATSYGGVAIGQYNIGAGNPLVWVETDPLLSVGNGSAALSSNAMETLKNGRTTLTNKAWKAAVTANPDVALGVTAPPSSSGGDALVVEGHARLKGKVILEHAQGDISMGIYGE